MKRLPFPSFRSGISVHETYFDVFMNALIINSSEILETSSELNQTSSELISTNSELILTISELILTISELILTLTHRGVQTTASRWKNKLIILI